VLLLREGGGNMKSEETIERGLDWLALHQAPSGRWGTKDFEKAGHCNCRDQAEDHDIAGTAFGLLPFLGAGHTHAYGKHKAIVLKGVQWLLKKQKSGGNFHDNAYENALATIAICEAYGMTRDPGLKAPAQYAINYILRAQSANGSWGYAAGDLGDTSVTGWQFSALKAGFYADLKVPDNTFNRVSRYLDSVADPGDLGYGYKTPGADKASSAAGLMCRQFLGWGPDQPSLRKGVDHLASPSNFVSRDQPAIYYLFYATQVMHHMGGKYWDEWNPKVRDMLADLQDQGKEKGFEHEKGSWSPRGDTWAKAGGRLMYTSLALLTLEVYYYHIPLYAGGAALQD
jgi:hypothetical protein